MLHPHVDGAPPAPRWPTPAPPADQDQAGQCFQDHHKQGDVIIMDKQRGK